MISLESMSVEGRTGYGHVGVNRIGLDEMEMLKSLLGRGGSEVEVGDSEGSEVEI